MTAVLRWREGAHERVWPLSRPITTIGRHRSNAVVIKARSVSRFHCRLVAGADRFLLQDCGARNGTYADGSRLEHPLWLAETTEIFLGDVRLWFELDDVGASPSVHSCPSAQASFDSGQFESDWEFRFWWRISWREFRFGWRIKGHAPFS